MSQNVMCPYCHNEALFMSSKEFYGTDYGNNLYVCHPCDARVGTHGRTDRPLGQLADAMLRDTRTETHKVVDPIWKNPFNLYTRTQVYRAISKLMNIPIEDTHIGMFDYGRCHALMFLARTGEVERYLQRQQEEKAQKRRQDRLRRKKQKEIDEAQWRKKNPGKNPNGTTTVSIPDGVTLYGIKSAVSKKFVFGIQEESKSKARKKLFECIGKDAYKWRFEVRKLKHYIVPPVNQEKSSEKEVS